MIHILQNVYNKSLKINKFMAANRGRLTVKHTVKALFHTKD